MGQTVLIFRTGQLGDTLVSLPAVRAIRQRHPGSVLVVLTDCHPGRAFVSSWDVFRETGWVDEVEFYTPDPGFSGVLRNSWRLLKRLRVRSPEHVYLLTPERDSWQKWRDSFFFKFLIGARYCHDFRAASKELKNTEGLLARAEPEWRRLLAITSATDEAAFKLPISEAARNEAANALAAAGVSEGRTLVAFAPGSKMSAKIWPAERYGEVGQRLLAAFDNIDLLVVGGAEDSPVARTLCTVWSRRSHNLAGSISVMGTAAALERCAVYVGNDTGAMHLAAMVGTPCVAVFSARDNPGKWEPYGGGHTVLRRDIECAGCMLETCRAHQNKCLHLITTGEVFAAVARVLESVQRSRQ